MIRTLDNPRRIYGAASHFAWDVLRYMEDELWAAGVCYIFAGRIVKRFSCTYMEASLALIYLQSVDAVLRTRQGYWVVRRCTLCGCTLRRGCKPRCQWIGPSLCSCCRKNVGVA